MRRSEAPKVALAAEMRPSRQVLTLVRTSLSERRAGRPGLRGALGGGFTRIGSSGAVVTYIRSNGIYKGGGGSQYSLCIITLTISLA